MFGWLALRAQSLGIGERIKYEAKAIYAGEVIIVTPIWAPDLISAIERTYMLLESHGFAEPLEMDVHEIEETVLAEV